MKSRYSDYEIEVILFGRVCDISYILIAKTVGGNAENVRTVFRKMMKSPLVKNWFDTEKEMREWAQK